MPEFDGLIVADRKAERAYVTWGSAEGGLTTLPMASEPCEPCFQQG